MSCCLYVLNLKLFSKIKQNHNDTVSYVKMHVQTFSTDLPFEDFILPERVRFRTISRIPGSYPLSSVHRKFFEVFIFLLVRRYNKSTRFPLSQLYEDDAKIGHQEFDLKLTNRVKMCMVRVIYEIANSILNWATGGRSRGIVHFMGFVRIFFRCNFIQNLINFLWLANSLLKVTYFLSMKASIATDSVYCERLQSWACRTG